MKTHDFLSECKPINPAFDSKIWNSCVERLNLWLIPNMPDENQTQDISSCERIFIEVIYGNKGWQKLTYFAETKQSLQPLVAELVELTNEYPNICYISRVYRVTSPYVMLDKLEHTNPLSSQLQKLTGCSYNAIDFENVFSDGLNPADFIRDKNTEKVYFVPPADIEVLKQSLMEKSA